MPLDEERARVWRAIEVNGDRLTELREGLPEMIKTAVQDAMPNALLSTEEHRWVQLAIKRESQTIEFRRAVIEKTLTSLLWSAVLGAGIVLKEYLSAHGWKP